MYLLLEGLPMHSNSRFIWAFLLLAILIAGCSNGAEVSTVLPSGEASIADGSSRIPLGAYDLIIDPSTLSLDVAPMRSIAVHYDVLDQLLPPICDKCFFANIEAYDPYSWAYTIKLGLRNYSMHIVYDPRGVVPEAAGYHLINPTGYFRMGSGSWPDPQRYGYVDFDSQLEKKMYPPGLFKEYSIQIGLPMGGKITQVPFLIDACYPDNCREVYSLKSLGNTGSLTPSGGSLTVKYEVKDWQDDISWVKINATPLQGCWVSFAKTAQDTWQAVLTNSVGAKSGTYHLEVGAYSPNAKGIILYSYVDVKVN
jgi:hypothetical protein